MHVDDGNSDPDAGEHADDAGERHRDGSERVAGHRDEGTSAAKSAVFAPSSPASHQATVPPSAILRARRTSAKVRCRRAGGHGSFLRRQARQGSPPPCGGSLRRSSRRRGGRRLRGRESGVRARSRGRGRVHLVAHLHLRGVDAPLAVVAERARAHGCTTQAGGIVEPDVRAVDRGDPNARAATTTRSSACSTCAPSPIVSSGTPSDAARSPGPSTSASRPGAAAIRSHSTSPRAVSICASAGTGSPASSSGDSTFGSTTTSGCTARTSARSSIEPRLIRIATVVAAKRRSRSARSTIARASSLRAGATASSRSRITSSARTAAARASFRSSSPGTVRQLRACARHVDPSSTLERPSHDALRSSLPPCVGWRRGPRPAAGARRQPRRLDRRLVGVPFLGIWAIKELGAPQGTLAFSYLFGAVLAGVVGLRRRPPVGPHRPPPADPLRLGLPGARAAGVDRGRAATPTWASGCSR